MDAGTTEPPRPVNRLRVLTGLVLLTSVQACTQRESPTESTPSTAPRDALAAALASTIPDSSLRAAIVLASEDGNPDRLRDIACLSAQGLGIGDLTGLELLQSLTVLDLANNEVRDLAPVAALGQLVFLDLTANRIRDIAPLASLSRLEVLTLDENQVVDVSPLFGLPALRVVEISGNPVYTPYLGTLVAHGVAVGLYSYDSPPPQAQWTEADLQPVHLADPELERAVRTQLRVPGYEQLQARHVQELVTLDLTASGVTSLDGIGLLTELRRLYLSGNEGLDLSPLASLPGLTKLHVSGVGLESVGFLRDVSTQVAELDLSRNRLGEADLRPLGELPNLRWLDLSGNELSDIAELGSLIHPIRLVLKENKITDLAALSGLTSLTVLCVSQNQVTDLSPLSGLENLVALAASNNLLQDISPLAELQKLVALNIGRNQIRDLGPVAALTKLEYLSFTRNHVSDVSPILGLARLLGLGYKDNALSRHALEVELPALEERSPNGSRRANVGGSGWTSGTPSLCTIINRSGRPCFACGSQID